MSDKEQLADILRWLEINIKNHPFSDVSIKLCVHDGKIKRLERGLVEKIQNI